MAGASSSSSSGGSWKYDVFINFRGEDTRRCFVCHLYEALKQKTLHTFIDSEELRKGDDLSELLKAIQDSRLSIVVFSKNYASSTWCLKELAQILECMKTQKQIVVPIFYEVDPSDVRKRRGSFAEAFAKYESDSNVDMEELESWKCSLIRATNFSGWDSKNYQDDTILIKSIVEDILKKLIHISPSEPDGLVGMDSHIKEIDLLLQLGVDGFRIVGIWGMGGIGKSTIAKAVYAKIAYQFEHSCFLDNVKEGFLTKNGGAKVTEELLSKILKVNDRHILDGGLNMIRERLGKKQVLLVLDDVDNLDQIETLIGKKPSFGGGSRIIITTRDKHLLAGYEIYKPKSFTDVKALELFRQYAFRTNPTSGNYNDLSWRAIKYADGLPLALKVLGAFLDNKSVREWEDELEKIKKIPNRGIQGVLRTSFDGLDDSQKNIFLDIACFHRGKNSSSVTKLLDSFGFFPHSGLRVLVDRALVTVSYYNELDMHDLIQEMGWGIANGDPRGPSRLWRYEDVHRVLSQNTDTRAVEGIVLNLWKLKELYINTEAFVTMKKLRLLQLENGYIDECEQHMSGDLKFLSCELRVLVWHGCPTKSLPSNFDPKKLVHLGMPYSRIEQLWEGTKPLQNLVRIDLSDSKYLIKTPDLTEATNLERLNLEGCVSLVEVHPSISALKKLSYLSLRGCEELKNFPSFIDMKSLEELDLSGCSNLEKFRLEFSEDMKELKHLWLDETAITEITSSINNLSGLRTLGLSGCRELRSLPSSIHLKSLEKLDLRDSRYLIKTPDLTEATNLESLNLEGCVRLAEVHPSISALKKLPYLSLRGCKELKNFPSFIDMKSLEELDLSGCSNLEKFRLEFSEDMKELKHLWLDETAIIEITSSINNHPGLGTLSLRGCRELRSLPSSIHLESLKELDVSGCIKLEEFPEISGDMNELPHLNLDETAIKELPSSIEFLRGLKTLTMSNCRSLVCLPDNICKLTCLQELYLDGCSKLSNLPENLGDLKHLSQLRVKGSGIQQLPLSILRFSIHSLSFAGCKEMTAPFSSWPTWIQENPSYSSLYHLDLSDCNLLEISDGIGHLSSLKSLELCRNNKLESLPAAMNRLVRLTWLLLKGCKRLKSIPELSSRIQFIDAHDCTALKTVSTPKAPYFEKDDICFLLYNCFELVQTNLFTDIVETVTDNQANYTGSLSVSLPAGSGIPDWFNHQCRGSSVTVQLPPNWFPNKFLGLAICAISNLRGADNWTTLVSALCWCTFKANDGDEESFHFPLVHYVGSTNRLLESDHMFLRYKRYNILREWQNEGKYTEARFRIVTRRSDDYGVIPNDSMTSLEDCSWITSCGVRLFDVDNQDSLFVGPVRKMAASSSSSGGSRKYDVCINFIGEDPGRRFVCLLYEALKQKALDTFIDFEQLRKGDDLSELLKAIQKSRLSIVVFSKNYASSTRCLKELVQILECMKTQKQIVVPIFYEVDPSNVRKRRRSFAEAFGSDSNVDMEELESWKCSLIKATNLSGWHSKNYQDDTILIKSIVEDILKKLIHISPSEPDGLVGMDSHIKEIDLLLQLGVDDFRIVGIWGMGGIGKSTIAKAVYAKIAYQFEHSCFLDNVKEGFLTKNGGAKVTEELLSKILKVNDRHTLDGGLNMIRERLGKKKVLLVLDDVDNEDQIETLIGKKPSFGGGSRIIITTRDKHLLAGYMIYEPKLFTDDKALELFRQYAFRTNPPSRNYNDLSRRAVKYAHGLPLALKVLGAFLDNKSVQEWEDELEKIKKIPNREIQGVLRTSFDGLDDSQKNIFLDIACFHRGKNSSSVTKLLDSFGFFPHSGLRVLVDRALVTVSYYNKLDMHDLIQEMGWDIVNGDPRGPSRLWRYEDVHRVLSQNKDTGAVEGIVLNLTELKELYINIEALVSMKKLRLIHLENDYIDGCEQHLSGDLKFLSCELRSLVWHRCPIKSLWSNFDPKNLVHLDMRGSHIELLWKGTKPLQNLVRIDLSDSQYLIKTPDLTEATNLEELNLEGCVSLVEVHPSISALENLFYLNLKGCKQLKIFPEISGDMNKLYRLKLDETAIKELPSSIEFLHWLKTLTMSNCRSLTFLPDNICKLARLRELYLDGCSKLSNLPENLGDLKHLNYVRVEGSGIQQLPFSILRLSELAHGSLSCNGCKEMTAPFSPWPTWIQENPTYSVLVELDLSDCNLLDLSDGIAHLSSLKSLKLCRNNNLESLPAAMNRLTQLSELYLEGCKRLKSIPELSSSIRFIDAHDCTALKTVSTPKPLNFEKICNCFRFYNCFQLVQTNLFTDIVESATDNQAYYHIGNLFVSLPAESGIPDWFTHQSRGSSVTVQLPPNWFPNKFLGLAICAISNLRGGADTLESALCFCTFKANDGDDEETSYFRLVYLVGKTKALLESDHMFLVYKNSSSLGEWLNEDKYTEARFRIVTRSVGRFEDCSWITSCGVRLIHVNNEDSFSVDLCDSERRKRKRETLEREKETMGMAVQEEGEECSLTGCTISLRKRQRKREREGEGVTGATGLETQEADVSGEGRLLTSL